MLKGLALLMLFQMALSRRGKPEYVTPPESWGQAKIEFRLYTKAKQWGYNLVGYNGPVVSPTEFTEETDKDVVSWEGTGFDPSKRTRCSPSTAWAGWTLVLHMQQLTDQLEQTST